MPLTAAEQTLANMRNVMGEADGKRNAEMGAPHSSLSHQAGIGQNVAAG